VPDKVAKKAEPVLVLAPSPGDATLCERFLGQAELQPHICDDPAALYDALAEPAAALVVADEALRGDAGARIRNRLAEQEDWSSLPLIVLTRRLARSGSEALADVARYGHVRLIERPVSCTVFVNAVLMAVRERRQQYRIRDLLAERAERLAQRDEFLATLGHELRNPLAAIMTCGEVLAAMQIEAPQVQRCVHTIATQSTQIKRLLDDLSDVSRIARRKLSLQTEPLDLKMALNDVVAQVQTPITEREQRLELAISNEPMPLLADATRLRQVLANLLVNASRYSPPGAVIQLNARPSGGLAEIRIRDQGIGMSAETRARIFEPFFQAPQQEGDSHSSRSGLGVGLALARSLVEMHAGTIAVESAGLGQGSEFRVALPLRAAPPAEMAPTQGARPVAQAARPQRVLLIEDNLDFGQGLKRLLELRGYAVDYAQDGVAGLRAAESCRPEVVVLDIGLPGLDGYEVAARLRRLQGFEGVRLIAVTGFGRKMDRRRSRLAGIDQHLVKPVTVPQLEAAFTPP